MTSEEKLDDIALLEADWDGGGATPISAVTLLTARIMLLDVRKWLREPDRVVPSPDGCIMFAWYDLTADEEYRELEIDEHEISWMVKDKDGYRHF